MNITQTSNENGQGGAAPAASGRRLALLDETRRINYWPARIATIENALSDARASRRSARMQLLHPAIPGDALPSDEDLYRDACEQVALWEEALEEALGAIL